MPPKKKTYWKIPSLTLGIASVILSPFILALLFNQLVAAFFFLRFFYLGFALSIIGFFCSIMSIVKKESAIGIAIAGMICSIWGFVEAFISFAFLSAIIEFFAAFANSNF